MRHKTTLFSALVILLIISSALFASSSARAQAPPREKPKLKDFGSSLKRLKWNARKQAAVETKQKKEKEKSSDDEDVIRVETTLVVSDVLVTDRRGRPVLGLTRDDFILTEDGQSQKIGVFALGDDVAVGRSIVLIIDYSSSQTPFIETSIEAAKSLVDKLAPRDRMAIVTDDVELLVDFTQDKEQLKKKLDSLEKASKSGGFFGRGPGRSLQFSALMASLRELFSDEDERPIIIFQTDGDERLSLRPMPGTSSIDTPRSKNQFTFDPPKEFSLADIWETAEKSRVTIYSIIPGIRFVGLSEREQLARARILADRWSLTRSDSTRQLVEKELKKGGPTKYLTELVKRTVPDQLAVATVAQVTGGWTEYLEDPSQANEVYTRILSDINRRYVIGYYPTNKERDGKRRQVQVEVRGRPEYIVWGRKSYYAPGPEE